MIGHLPCGRKRGRCATDPIAAVVDTSILSEPANHVCRPGVLSHLKPPEAPTWDNALTTLDLSALSACPELHHISLHHNPLKQLDVTPLLGCPKFSSLVVDQAVPLVARSEGRPDRLPEVFSSNAPSPHSTDKR